MADEAPQEGVEIVEGYKPASRPPTQKKIAVLGTCPSRSLAPVDDLSWEIWTIGPGGKNANRWEALFEIHGDGSWPVGFRDYLEELKQEKPPKRIFTENPMPEWPANVVYPKGEMFAKYGRMWFSSSIAYAVALAIEEGATDLGIYGIDLESGEEYISQFTGAKYFINLARLAGVNIHMPEGCGLLRDPNPYPDAWETHLAATLQAKIDYLNQVRAEKQQQHATLAAEINQVSGELAAFDFIKQRYVINGEDPGRRAPDMVPRPTVEGQLEKIVGLLEHGGLINNG